MAKKFLVLVLTAFFVATAGACGSSGDEGSGAGSSPKKEAAGSKKPTAVEMVQVAYEETAAQQTSKTAFEVTVTDAAAEPGNSGRPAPMTMTMSGQGVTNFSGTESAITMNMFGMGAIEARQIGSIAYMKMPEGFQAQVPDARPWIKIDMNAVHEEQLGASPMDLQGEGTQDPSQQLAYLRGVSDSVKKLGEEKVRGVRTTHYRAITNLKREAARQDADVREAYDEMIEKLGTSRLPLDVWIDGQNRARRVAMDMTVRPPQDPAHPNGPRGDEMRMKMVADYYDFGTPVNVQAPPKDQTMDGRKLMAGQQTVNQ